MRDLFSGYTYVHVYVHMLDTLRNVAMTCLGMSVVIWHVGFWYAGLWLAVRVLV